MAITTKFDVTTKIHKCTDNESSRYALAGVHCCASSTAGNVWLTATNGRMLAAVETNGRTDKPIIVPTDVMPTTKRSVSVTLNGRWENNCGKFTADTIDGRFPKCNEVVPLNVEQHTAVKINAKVIAKMADAVAKPVAVLGEHGIGVIMPVACDSKVVASEAARYRTLAMRYATSFDNGIPLSESEAKAEAARKAACEYMNG